MRMLAIALCGALLVSCGDKDKEGEAGGQAAEPAPDTYRVKLETTKGDMVIQVHRDWSPIGADHFLKLVKAGYYNDCAFFRVMRNFIVQCGINSDPAVTRRWMNTSILDDPPSRAARNRKYTVAFGTAPGRRHSRSTHIFINLKHNRNLDAQRFTAFGEIVEGRDVVEKINGEYGESPNQGMMARMGRAYLEKRYPRLDYIMKATVVE